MNKFNTSLLIIVLILVYITGIYWVSQQSVDLYNEHNQSQIKYISALEETVNDLNIIIEQQDIALNNYEQLEIVDQDYINELEKKNKQLNDNYEALMAKYVEVTSD